VLEEVIHVGKKDPDESGKFLPSQEAVIEADLGKGELLFFVSNMIKKVFKVAFVFGGINHNSPFGKGFEKSNLRGIQGNMRKK